MIFLQNLAFSSLHNLYIRYIEIVYLLYKDHTVSVCHYPNSGNPYHPSTATGLPGSIYLEGQIWPNMSILLTGLLLLRDDKDFQTWDGGTQTLCGPYTADIKPL